MTIRAGNRGAPQGLLDKELRVYRIPPLTSGVQTRISARNIPANASPDLVNVDLDDPDCPSVRDGYSEILCGVGGMQEGTLRISGMSYFNEDPQSRLMIVAQPGENGGVYFTTSPEQLSGWTEARVKRTPEGDVDNKLDVSTDSCKLFQGNGLTWIIPQSGTPIHAMSVSGEIVSCGDDQKAPPLDAADGCYFLNRALFLAREKIFWSKLLPTADDCVNLIAFERDGGGADGGSLSLGPERGGTAVAITPWRNTSVLCFWDTFIEEVAINPANPLQSARRVVEPRLGCGARDTVVQFGSEVYFLDNAFHFRKVSASDFGEQRGVQMDPLSDPIRSILPKRITKKYAHKSWAEYLGDRIYLFVPIDGSEECNACLVWDTSQRIWMGLWQFADTMSCGMVADIRGNGFELFTASADASTSRVFQMFDGSYSDDGASITYQETTRAHTDGLPEHKKRPRWIDTEFNGGKGVEVDISMRTSERDSFVRCSRKTIEESGTSSFPLTFALTFPLTESTPELTVERSDIVGKVDGDMPLYMKDLARPMGDFPVHFDSTGPGCGRIVQWKIESEVNGKTFQRVSSAVASEILNVERYDET